MPRRDDIHSIAIIGSGPIVIGQACEFDYSGVQALKVLREEGYRTVLVNSNPATIMTDPGWADATYIEPLDLAGVTDVLRRERPDALLPTLGGQTALNLAMQLADAGVLDELGIELIGASRQAIQTAEDRQAFGAAMDSVGLRVPRSAIATTVAEAHAALTGDLRLPVVIRPAFTLGGHGGGFASTPSEFAAMAARGLAESPISQILVEESVHGWGEFELEVIRDKRDNVVIVCSIENIDPMGVHTGDSVCVAPAMTLSDREFQTLRDAAAAVIRAVGVETGGSNVQFGVNRETGEIVVIEMNPRVSRSSALASKATGYPIAKVAARLAVGYTLDEIPNDITRTTPASFEPTIDYVVVKAPRFAFEKFPGADETLTTQMKSVGEAMGIGRNFCEAFGKAMRSRELDSPPRQTGEVATALADRLDAMLGRLREGTSPDELAAESSIHPWFCHELARTVAAERAAAGGLAALDADDMRQIKRHGISDARIGRVAGCDEAAVRARRHELGVRPVYKTVDSCGGEVAAETAYVYSAYDRIDEPLGPTGRSVLILGSGPNRIGQGIEFDYCCVQAVHAWRRRGFDTVMVNCNPETVSTDYDTADRLYFEPLTLEDVLEVIARERPEGVMVQFGGQTPLRLAHGLVEAGVPILGTDPAAIDLAEDRRRFGEMLAEIGLRAPDWAMADSAEEAVAAAERIGYPVLVRPSYVLGGRAMRVCYDAADVRAAPVQPSTLVDRFVEDAIEVDVDAVCDGATVVIGAVMEHVEEAGVHSGDSSCVIPPLSIGPEIEDEIRRQTRSIALGLGVRGLVNVQFALHEGEIYVLEANPRASRTVPFVEKAMGIGLVEAACRVAAGDSLASMGIRDPEPTAVAVKEAVLPFARFPGADPILGPEMRATGEVMAIAPDFPTAYAKAVRAVGHELPKRGTDPMPRAFLTVCDRDKPAATLLAQRLHDMGFEVLATPGTARRIAQLGIPVTVVAKVGQENGAESVVDLIREHRVDLIVNTPVGRGARADGYQIRSAAISARVPCITTLAGASAAVQAIARAWKVEPKSLQELHA